jgi:hypothetical protein
MEVIEVGAQVASMMTNAPKSGGPALPSVLVAPQSLDLHAAYNRIVGVLCQQRDIVPSVG